LPIALAKAKGVYKGRKPTSTQRGLLSYESRPLGLKGPKNIRKSYDNNQNE
jgi:hypothetical protein